MVHDPIRGLIALRKVVVVAIGTALVPMAIKRVRPLAKRVGDQLVKLGEYLREDSQAEEAAKPEPESVPPAATTSTDFEYQPPVPPEPDPQAETPNVSKAEGLPDLETKPKAKKRKKPSA